MREIELVLHVSHSYYCLGRVPATLDLLLAHRDPVERLQDPRLTGHFYFWLAHTSTYVSRLERNDEPFWPVQSYWAVGFKHDLIGDFDAGLEAARRAGVIGEARADVRIITHADWLSRWLYGTRGDWEDGVRTCTASLEQSRDAFTTIAATGWMGYAYLETGEPAEAIPKRIGRGWA